MLSVINSVMEWRFSQCLFQLAIQNYGPGIALCFFLAMYSFKLFSAQDSVQSKLSKSTFGSTTYWPRFTQKTKCTLCKAKRKQITHEGVISSSDVGLSYITIANIYSITFNGIYIIYNSLFTLWNIKFAPLSKAITMTYH